MPIRSMGNPITCTPTDLRLAILIRANVRIVGHAVESGEPGREAVAKSDGERAICPCNG